jgi:hypothetical protein
MRPLSLFLGHRFFVFLGDLNCHVSVFLDSLGLFVMIEEGKQLFVRAGERRRGDGGDD